MANYQSLKTAINAVIKANGNKEITGTVLNEVLLAMVNSLGAGYQFAGVATPSTNPGTPDQKVFYIASQAGTYTNFGGAVVSDGIAIFKWNGTWTTETLDLPVPEQVQSDWTEDDPTKKSYIKHKPNIPEEQVQSDWTEDDPTKKSYIKHKPNIPPSANVDPVPTEDSPNAVSSGGVYNVTHGTLKTRYIPFDLRGESIIFLSDEDMTELFGPATMVGGQSMFDLTVGQYQHVYRVTNSKSEVFEIPAAYSNVNGARKIVGINGNLTIELSFTITNGVYLNAAIAKRETSIPGISYEEEQDLTPAQRRTAQQNIGLEKDVAGGVAGLDGNGKIVEQQIPTDVVDGANLGSTSVQFGAAQQLTPTQQVNAQNNMMGKAYAPAQNSGLGKVYLDKNNGVLTQAMMQAINTVYVIQYDYTMSGNITVPAGCTLEFDGGSISGNGTGKDTITCNNTSIKNCKHKFTDITLAGNNYYQTSWFNYNIRESLSTASANSVIIVDSEITLTSEIQLPLNCKVIGKKGNKVNIVGIHDGLHLNDGVNIKGLVFYGQGSTSDIQDTYASHAIAGNSGNIIIENCKFYNFYTMSPWIIFLRQGNAKKNIIIRNCIFDGFGSNGNGTIGDATGNANAIFIIGDYENVDIENNIFTGAYGNEDTYYISIQELEISGSGFPNSQINENKRKSGYLSIAKNTFFNSTNRSIKVFSSDVCICDNIIINNFIAADKRSEISVFNGENIVISNNSLNGVSSGKMLEITSCKNCVVTLFNAALESSSYVLSKSNIVISKSDVVGLSDLHIAISNQNVTDNSSNAGLIRMEQCKNITFKDSEFKADNIGHIIISTGSFKSIGDLSFDNVRFQVGKVYAYPVLLDNSGSTGMLSFKDVAFNIDDCSNPYTITTDNLAMDDVSMGGSPTTFIVSSIVDVNKTTFVELSLFGNASMKFSNIMFDYTGNREGRDAISIDSSTASIEIDGIKNCVKYRSIIKAYNTSTSQEFSGTCLMTGIGVELLNQYGNSFILNNRAADKFTFGNFIRPVYGYSYGITPPKMIVGSCFLITNQESEKPIWYTGSGWIDATGTPYE